jgi:hypothetical protein
MTLIIGSSYLAGSLLTWAVPILLVIGLLTWLFRATSRLPSNATPSNGHTGTEPPAESQQPNPARPSPDAPT